MALPVPRCNCVLKKAVSVTVLLASSSSTSSSALRTRDGLGIAMGVLDGRSVANMELEIILSDGAVGRSASCIGSTSLKGLQVLL